MEREGRLISAVGSEYPIDTPRQGWAEQDPIVWLDAAIRVTREAVQMAGIDPRLVSGIGLAGQMHSLVCIDTNGKVLRPAILWNDQRTQAQCDEIHRRIGREKFIQITGNVALTGFIAPKILWVKENESDVYAKAAHVLLPKDFVRYKLTGDFAMDMANGAGTVLLDWKRRGFKSSMHDVLVLQRRVFAASGEEGLGASELASLARAWDILEERKRILRGKPLPGSLKPAHKKSKPFTPLAPIDGPAAESS